MPTMITRGAASAKGFGFSGNSIKTLATGTLTVGTTTAFVTYYSRGFNSSYNGGDYEFLSYGSSTIGTIANTSDAYGGNKTLYSIASIYDSATGGTLEYTIVGFSGFTSAPPANYFESITVGSTTLNFTTANFTSYKINYGPSVGGWGTISTANQTATDIYAWIWYTPLVPYSYSPTYSVTLKGY